MVIFTARQNLANLNEVKMNLIVKFANLAGKSYIIAQAGSLELVFGFYSDQVFQFEDGSFGFLV